MPAAERPAAVSRVELEEAAARDAPAAMPPDPTRPGVDTVGASMPPAPAPAPAPPPAPALPPPAPPPAPPPSFREPMAAERPPSTSRVEEPRLLGEAVKGGGGRRGAQWGPTQRVHVTTRKTVTAMTASIVKPIAPLANPHTLAKSPAKTYGQDTTHGLSVQCQWRDGAGGSGEGGAWEAGNGEGTSVPRGQWGSTCARPLTRCGDVGRGPPPPTSWARSLPCTAAGAR
jgi:hypothetical protein